MNLILASTDIPTDYLEQTLTPLFAQKQTPTVGLIPTAADLSKGRWQAEKARNEIQKLGLHILEVDLKNQTTDSLYAALAPCDIIYMSGGNAFYLLDWVRKSGFDTVIRRLLAEGKIYAASSAGSYIMCPTIEVATWKNQDRNTIGLKDLTGLGLVPFLIFAHFEEKWRELVETEIKKISHPLVALADGQAVIVANGNLKVIGPGERVFYNSFKKTA